VGFDPLRQALYERGKHRPGEKEPAALLKTAIDGVPAKGSDGSGGALGVKLYPPMGFRATANAELADSRFANPAFLISSDTGIGPQIGAHLDRALSRLYTWCSEKNVPVMAHTTNSFGPSLEYEDRANPQYWGQVLKTHPKLRINMAHFGHFKPAVIGNDVKVHIKECWEWTIGELMAASPDSYAYADISSIAEILKPGPSRKLFDCMRIFKDNFKNSADKLIYGTDWSMIAQTEGFPRAFSDQPYTDLMAKFLHLVGYSKGEIEGIMFRNATRYLGLSKAERAAFGDNCSRGRLEKFYTAQALPAEWMKAFD
jgi:predicted TIM-barrel fold metal-dependent hydrolase